MYQRILNEDKKIEKISSLKKMLESNIESVDIKINCFYTEIFAEETRKPLELKTTKNHNDEFTKKLELITTKNSLGYACNIDNINELINWINMFFSKNKEEKFQLILGKITTLIINGNQLMDLIKQRNLEPDAWNYIINSISNNNPLSKCPALLYEFFKIEKIGLREAYIGEYLNKMCDVVDCFSDAKKRELIEVLNSSFLDKSISNQLQELIMM